MYCQGLGDCFLLTIPQGQGRPYSILIDFGLAMNTPRQGEIMTSVIRSVAQVTGGVVDLLAVTHEHWDHVSGFVQAAQELTPDKLVFKHLWQAWTENPADSVAQQLKETYGKAEKSLRLAQKMAASFKEDEASRKKLELLKQVLAFFGPAAASEGDGTVADAMATPLRLVGGAGNKSAYDFLEPGACKPLPNATSGPAKDMCAYVLGPPRKLERMRKIKPGTAHPETYGKSTGADGDESASAGLDSHWAWMTALHAAVDSSAHGVAAEFDRTQPFDRSVQIDLKKAEEIPFFQERYFSKRAENQERRIDGDWLGLGAQQLALQLESYTNNTSLVLAFELPVSKKILLFAGDAQVGNWLSWHDQDYPASGGGRVTAAELLARTILYKVGHHGSHNATLREKGLELMTDPQLSALLPVEAAGVRRLGYGEMPLQSLVAALKARTGKRLLRLDEAWSGGRPPGTWTSGLESARLSAETITVETDSGTAQRPLYMEVTLADLKSS
jgi:beta-lactamase superfamily II metal-dependent hydrolase